MLATDTRELRHNGNSAGRADIAVSDHRESEHADGDAVDVKHHIGPAFQQVRRQPRRNPLNFDVKRMSLEQIARIAVAPKRDGYLTAVPTHRPLGRPIVFFVDVV